MYQQLFDNYVCVGDSIEIERDGKHYRACIHFDDNYSIDDDDMHNPDQSVTGCNDEQQKQLMASRAAWLNDEWFYCGIVVEALCPECGGPTDKAASLWGLEANSSYPDPSQSAWLSETATDLTHEIA